ncbi:alpha,alpha-trehalose-phosphate synthase [Panicum miliaceum]|uniref:alpha,alpha-trehalose-phosphate synthase (UDP-forming) n=1 Tax=Panicum miliaceum TaxID=4540 RepID=A0A3L6SY98_PANMI|nr:alpha,alpha-trehalose-phosphate synthase [Panicum miliaceum]
MSSDAAGGQRSSSSSNRARGDAALMPTSSPFTGDGGGAGSPTRVERMLREREHSRRHLFASSDAMDTDGAEPASASAGTFLADGVQSPGRASPANMEDAGGAAPGHAARPPLAGSRSGFRRLGLRGMKQRLLVVANRLPVSANRRGEDQWSLEISAGGLRCIPVFLDEEIVHQYYNGYCNNILWPLFHYLGLPQEDRLATTRNFESQFDAYKRANQMFADVVYQHYQEGDVIWCHDYHLMFLPKCLKDHDINMKVGWFLHTPFPSSEIYRTLPSRLELLRSVLCADLVGFHTYDYARHFVSACTRILGLEGTPEGVEDQGRLTRVAAFPIGIDSDRFKRALELPAVKRHINELTHRFAGRKVMLGVDRLDMIKGIPQKILAFEKFLEENPDWNDKVVLLQIAVPTRTDVPEYQKLTSQVHEIVGRINGRFGTLTAVPIHHLDRSLDFHALCALYAVTDVALVTSLRDGMNLVSYEYVACQGSKKGVLILSEFAGAAQSLGAGAILVNPWNITEVADSIRHALMMPSDEREKRHRHNYAHVTTHTAQDWAETFVCELNDTVAEAQLRTRQVPPGLPSQTAIQQYLRSKNRLLILGFNSTLTEPVESSGRRGGDQIKEMELKLHPDLKGPLKALCEDEHTTVIVLSGSDRSVLDENFGEFKMWLAAEHGMFLRPTYGEWMTTMPEHLNMDWVDSVKHVFEYFTERTPRSHFEHRETSFVWNYKYADVEFGRLQARDMLQHLWTGPISNAAVDVVQGSRSVEVRSVGVTKGAAIDRILGEIVHSENMVTPIDYVLCVGHFLGKDEDIYVFFDPEYPSESKVKPEGGSASLDRRPNGRPSNGRSNSRNSQSRTQKALVASEKSSSSSQISTSSDHNWREGSSVLDLKGENYFSCAVGRKRSNARYLLNSSEDVVSFLKELATATAGFHAGNADHMFLDRQ